MEFLYPFFISFILIFLSELGDKTQLLVLSFSTKDKAKNILFGVALVTFFSHVLEILSNIIFIIFGLLGFVNMLF